MRKRSRCTVFILTSVFCLLPVILALALYNDLPERIVMQWDFEGNPNWDAPKAIGAFAMPLCLTAIHIITLLFLYNDPKRRNHPKALRVIVEWLTPFLSLTLTPIILFSAMGVKFPIVMMSMFFVGLIFILSGNYLPKCRHNYVMGIRLPWTLNDVDNWNKTHRMAGVLWIIGGIVFISISFIPFSQLYAIVIILSLITIITCTPILYSYSIYKKSGRRIQKEIV